MKRVFVIPMMGALLIFAGCEASVTISNDDKPINPAAFHIDKSNIMGEIGGGAGYVDTHYERYIDDLTGHSIVCFNPKSGGGTTSTNIACIDEGKQ